MYVSVLNLYTSVFLLVGASAAEIQFPWLASGKALLLVLFTGFSLFLER